MLISRIEFLFLILLEIQFNFLYKLGFLIEFQFSYFSSNSNLILFNFVFVVINKQSPLHYAAMIGNSKISEFLLQNGADINAVDKENNTPLHEASRKGRLNVVQVLLAHGADATLKGYGGETAAEKGSTDEIRNAINDYLEQQEKETEE